MAGSQNRNRKFSLITHISFSFLDNTGIINSSTFNRVKQQKTAWLFLFGFKGIILHISFTVFCMLWLNKKKDQGFKWNTAHYDYKNLRFLPLCTSWRNQRKADSSAGKSNLEIISKVKFKYLLIFKNIHQPLPRSALHSFGSGGKQEPWWNGEGDKCVIYPSSSRLIDKIITRLKRRMKTDSGACKCIFKTEA